MSLLGVDLGEKRIGLAIGDEVSRVATPLATLQFRGKENLLAELKKVIAEYQITKIIVGLPKTLKGEIGFAAKKITEQVEWLKEHTDQPWVFWDERLTTKEVERVLLEADLSRGKRKQVRDQLAAQRILQSYLDCHRDPS